LRTVDGGLQNYLKEKMDLDLNRTFVFFMGDHGTHMSLEFMWGTKSGRLENQLPVLFMLAPNSFF